MDGRSFRVGQVVDFIPSPVDVAAPMHEYKILRLLPYHGGEQLYRIKTITETLVRVAKHSELTFGPKGYGRVLQFCSR